MKSVFIIAMILASVVAIQAFHLPFQLLGASSEEYNPGVAKRNYYETKPYKRVFNADDLTLRFGKRGGAGENLAFSPDMLALRFGK